MFNPCLRMCISDENATTAVGYWLAFLSHKNCSIAKSFHLESGSYSTIKERNYCPFYEPDLCIKDELIYTMEFDGSPAILLTT